MNRTQFHRVLAIYIAGLAVLASIFCTLHHRVAQSTKKAVSFVSHAIEIRNAYAAVRDEDESSLPVHDHEMIQKSFPLTSGRASLHRSRQRLRIDRSRRRLRQSSRTRRGRKHARRIERRARAGAQRSQSSTSRSPTAASASTLTARSVAIAKTAAAASAVATTTATS